MRVHPSSTPWIRCEMNIKKYRSKNIVSKIKPVHVDVVRKDGIRFISELLIPADPQLLLGFHISFLDHSAFLLGRIVAIEERKGGQHSYEVCFKNHQDSRVESEWLRLLCCISEYQQKKYMKIHDAYNNLSDNLIEGFNFDVRR